MFGKINLQAASAIKVIFVSMVVVSVLVFLLVTKRCWAVAIVRGLAILCMIYILLKLYQTLPFYMNFVLATVIYFLWEESIFL
jgi:hypothetical protein